MHSLRPLLGAFALFILALTAQTSHAQISSIEDAINKAGRQRMLSQRMAKAYLQIGQNIDAERSRKILDDSVALFDRQEVELKVYAPTAEIKEVYARLDQKWNAYKELLVGTAPSPESGLKVLALSNEVLSLAHTGTQLLEKHTGKTSGKLVNMAGRQRMLSQRMAMFYQSIGWNLKAAQLQADLDKSKQEFVLAMQVLQSAPETTEAIKNELMLVSSQWVFFEHALTTKSGDHKSLATNVATTSERILAVMDKVTGLYAK